GIAGIVQGCLDLCPGAVVELSLVSAGTVGIELDHLDPSGKDEELVIMGEGRPAEQGLDEQARRYLRIEPFALERGMGGAHPARARPSDGFPVLGGGISYEEVPPARIIGLQHI